MNIEEAKAIVENHLSKEEEKINNFGSALPGYENPNIKLEIISDMTEAHEFGWVFYYNSAKYIETGDFRYALGGNAPIIINKHNRELVVTGTAYETSYYVRNYINTGDPNREK